MTVIARMLPDNPVLTKEMRVRMRGARAYWLIFGFLGFLSIVMLTMYAGYFLGNIGYSNSAQVGSTIFNSIVLAQVFLALFITPAITSGALTIEKEQRTLDMLMMTQLSRRSVIVGKLLSGFAFTALLLFTSLPLISVSFMLGGVDPGMVASNYMMLLAGSFCVGAMGLMWSSLARNTTQAVMYTYLSMIGLGCGVAPLLASYQNNSFGYDLATNVLAALGQSWFGSRFLGIPGPEGVGFALTCVLAGVLFGAVAMARIETYPERRAGLLRLLTAGFLFLQLLPVHLILVSRWASRGSEEMGVMHHPLFALGLTMCLLMIVTPIFATGELTNLDAKNIRAWWRSGWSRKGLRQGGMEAGLPYLLLLTVVCLVAYALPFLLTGRPGGILESTQEVLHEPGIPGNLLKVAFLLFSSVAGFALFCQCLSVLIRNRWVAWLLTMVGAFAVFAAPFIAKASAHSDELYGASFYFAYLNPLFSMVEFWDASEPSMLFLRPIWFTTSVLWLAIGAASYLMMGRIAAGQSRRAAKAE